MSREQYYLSKKILKHAVDVKVQYESVITRALDDKIISNAMMQILLKCKKEWKETSVNSQRVS